MVFLKLTSPSEYISSTVVLSKCLTSFKMDSPYTMWSIPLSADKLFLLIIVFVLSIIYLWTNRTRDFPTGPYCWPFIGNSNFLHNKPHIYLTGLKEKYGDVFSINLGKQKAVVVCSHEGIVEALVKKSPKMCGRPHGFLPHAFFNGSLDGGTCFSELSVKYKIKKDFMLHSLDSISCTETLENILVSEVQKMVFHIIGTKSLLDLEPLFESTFLRLMLYIVNGKLYSPNDENFLEIWKTFQLRSHEIQRKWPNLSAPLFGTFRQPNTMEFLERTQLQFEYQRDIVNRHKDCFNPDIICDVVDHGLVMLERYDDMGQLDQEELDSLFVELCGSGYRQLSATLQWLVLYVTNFPHVQDKVYAELLSVVGKDRLPALSDQPYLPYTCAVIMETHRLATVMPFLYPHTTIEELSFMGYEIPKDTTILCNIWSMHHDARYWKQPMKYDPDRFIKDGALHIPDQFLPFGDGLRACPGESLVDIQLFLFASHLLFQTCFTLHGDAELEGDFKGFILAPKPFTVTTAPRETVALELTESTEEIQDTICYIDGEEI